MSIPHFQGLVSVTVRLSRWEDRDWYGEHYLPYRYTRSLWTRSRRHVNGERLLSIFCNVDHTARRGAAIVNLDLDRVAAALGRRANRHIRYAIVDESGGILVQSAVDDPVVTNISDFAQSIVRYELESNHRPWMYVAVVDTAAYGDKIRRLQSTTFFLLLALFPVLLAAAFLITLRIYTPFYTIMKVLARPEDGAELIGSGETARSDELRFIIGNLMRSMDHEKQMESELLHSMTRLKRAQTVALQAQINPHFLYNTLDSMNFLAARLSGGSNDISKAIRALTGMLEISLRTDTDLIPLEREIEHARHFLYILDLQYGDLFDVSWQVHNAAHEVLVPKITLQPLIENAVYHGIKPARNVGTVTVRCEARGRRLRLSVSDDGAGMDTDRLRQVQGAVRAPTLQVAQHIGLANLALRYRLIFGDGYDMKVNSAPNAGTVVEIEMPLVGTSARRNHRASQPAQF